MSESRLRSVPGVSPFYDWGFRPAARDMGLIRALLLEIETGGAGWALEEWDDTAIRRHLGMMVEAGLVEGRTEPGGTVYFEGLTWAGHDFLALETIKRMALSLAG